MKRTLSAVLLVLGVLGSVLAGGGVAVAATTPGAPTAVTASVTGAGTALVKWSPPTTAGGAAVTGYLVRRDGVNAEGSSTWSTTVSKTARSQAFTKLVPGRTYTFSVRATSAAGLGPAATVKLTAAALPGAPVTPAFSSGAWAPDFRSFDVTVTWAPPASDGGSAITGYRVTRLGYDTDGTGPWSTVVGPAGRSFTFSKVGTTNYTFTVEAITAAGKGPAASTQFIYAVPNYVHAPPIVSTSADRAAGSVTVTWDFLYYGNHAVMPDVVQVSRDGQGADGTGPWCTTVPVTSRSFTFTNLTPGVPYTFSVMAWRNFLPDDKRGGSITVTL